MQRATLTVDANEAVARVAYALSEVIAIYPITPSSPMGEWADQWASELRPNLWGEVPQVIEMQSEAGAAGAVHGALTAGALSTTFTASQGLLLMIPNMYKIAGELTPAVFHVAARALATQGLSIFGDHSDVMAVRQTGWAMLASSSVQEAADLALVAHAATLEARLPFMHFFDGFRTSHEVQKIDAVGDEVLHELISKDLVLSHRRRGLSPDNPVIRGTAQNPDIYFQARETVNPFYLACPKIVQAAMDRFAATTGRAYRLFDYAGVPDATDVIVIMGSGAGAVEETVERLNNEGRRTGLVTVRLYRPFDAAAFLAALPASVERIAVLDRTKEPGAAGEPLYVDVVAALHEAWPAEKPMPRVLGGRYGLGSKEFTPAMANAVFENLRAASPKRHFTVGINDDVTNKSLAVDSGFSTEDLDGMRAVFYGLGADGTVGANKNSIKIIGDATDLNVQAYFVYDSKKSGSMTVSHLRASSKPISSTYLISEASFVACHQFQFVQKRDILSLASPGAVFLLNAPYGPEEIWDHLPREAQQQIVEKKLRFFVIDAYKVAREAEMGQRINTVMQVCFFAICGIIPADKAIYEIKKAIQKTYGKRGEAVVARNIAAVDAALAHLHEVSVPAIVTSSFTLPSAVPDAAPAFVKEVTAYMMSGHGDALPVSLLPIDGTYPTATAKWEKRSIAQEIPVWDMDTCIQCGKCVLVCPHSVIRGKVYDNACLENSPESFLHTRAKWKEFDHHAYTIQVSPDDCTGCQLCVEVCPAKNKRAVGRKAINMEPLAPRREQEIANWEYFLQLPDAGAGNLNLNLVKDVQLLRPLFEFSGACAGCGETPYLKLLTQLFGDRMVVANATGCSSIYGGNQPTTPWSVNDQGRGPAWSNSLFEDNAEFGLGMRACLDQQHARARALLQELASEIGGNFVDPILENPQLSEGDRGLLRQDIAALKLRLSEMQYDPRAADLLSLADALQNRSVWIIGGDGWAYDIGFGGLDHILSTGRNVNILVMDTEVYSNTGGQCSKSTPRAAVAKFAAGGKNAAKKDLALIAMMYRSVYVARIAMGANDAQTVKAIREAEAYPGTSLIIAYSHCIAHGYDLVHGMDQQKAAVLSGYWPLLRYNPELADAGQQPLQLDSKPPKIPLKQYAYNETRYTMLAHGKPEAAKRLLELAQEDVNHTWEVYSRLAGVAPAEDSAGSAE